MTVRAMTSLDPKELALRVARSVRYRLVRRSFPLFEKLGVHLTLNHFYEPIPDTRDLPARLWRKRRDVPGVDMREEAQVSLAKKLGETYRAEFATFAERNTGTGHDYYLENGAITAGDAEALYGMTRMHKPKRIIEIGSGISTRLFATALKKNQEETGLTTHLTAIEPYPDSHLESGFPGLTRLLRQKVEDVDLDVFRELGAGDILFIDSSHVLKAGSDVQYEFLEILPRLRDGVIVHVHDIFFPFDYPREWLTRERRFWTEQYLLQAYLAHNRDYEVLWAGAFLHAFHPDVLAASFPAYRRDKSFPGSFWFRRVAGGGS